jgi:hypothetical protein
VFFLQNGREYLIHLPHFNTGRIMHTPAAWTTPTTARGGHFLSYMHTVHWIMHWQRTSPARRTMPRANQPGREKLQILHRNSQKYREIIEFKWHDIVHWIIIEILTPYPTTFLLIWRRLFDETREEISDRFSRWRSRDKGQSRAPSVLSNANLKGDRLNDLQSLDSVYKCQLMRVHTKCGLRFAVRFSQTIIIIIILYGRRTLYTCLRNGPKKFLRDAGHWIYGWRV